MLQEAGGRWIWPREVQREYTNWQDELRATREACVLADLSHHQMDQVINGPDALGLLTRLCTNSFEGFEVGKSKQAVMCNYNGEFIGDGVLQRIGEEKFVMSGKDPVANWLAYHVDTGEYDASETIYPKSSATTDDPHFFTYQVQGPNALDVMKEVTDDPLPDVPFFNFGEVTIDGHTIRSLRHGMSGEVGFELQGPYEYGEDIKQAILDVGQDYGIRRLGTRAYEPLSVKLGWVTTHVPAIYTSDELRDYREWLPADSYEGKYSIAGSYASDDITDYYLSPVDIGYTHMISFDHEFIGREALESEVENPRRDRVTLVWDEDDVLERRERVGQRGGDDDAHGEADEQRDGDDARPPDELPENDVESAVRQRQQELQAAAVSFAGQRAVRDRDGDDGDEDGGGADEAAD
jgi:vanillate/3-O-methylgallate O-demethylase